MPLKTVIVTVPSFQGTSNRDLGKTFLITEWPAAHAEDWGMRMAFAINRDAEPLSLSLRAIGMEGIAVIGINNFLRGRIRSDEVIPLLNELLECVKIVPDLKAIDKETGRPVAHPIIADADIEEVATRIWLRVEVLSLHLNFSVSAAISALKSSIMAKEAA